MKEKGIDELLSAYNQFKNEYGDKVTLDVVGFFEDEYKDIIEKMNSDGLIAFHGFQNDAVPYYQNADCIVMPSYHEGLSNVLLEASAIGRPCITTNIPGCKEAVEDNTTGFLVSPKNTAELYEAMKRFINLSSEEKQALGKNARAKIENEFDKNVVVSQVIEKILG